MSTHDRGAFGELLARVKATGAEWTFFSCNFTVADDSENRWMCATDPLDGPAGHGRTGEEALRRLVEILEVDRSQNST